MADLADAIRKALDEHAATESNERLEARLAELESSRGRDFTKDELKRILGELDDDDRDEIVAALVGEERWSSIRDAESGSPGAGDDDAGDGPERKPRPAERRTRPGRRTGNAYDWDVDEDGNVVELDVARIYSGDDEDEEVELPSYDAGDDAGDDDAGDDEEAAA